MWYLVNRHPRSGSSKQQILSYPLYDSGWSLNRLDDNILMRTDQIIDLLNHLDRDIILDDLDT